MSKARSSQIKICATEFPSFLYADASKFDKDKPHRGLLRGPILVRVSFWSFYQLLLPLNRLLGFPMYFHWPKHGHAEGCSKSLKITSGDP
jgi:hypothetical protein